MTIPSRSYVLLDAAGRYIADALTRTDSLSRARAFGSAHEAREWLRSVGEMGGHGRGAYYEVRAVGEAGNQGD